MNASIREFQTTVHTFDALPSGMDASASLLTPASGHCSHDAHHTVMVQKGYCTVCGAEDLDRMYDRGLIDLDERNGR